MESFYVFFTAVFFFIYIFHFLFCFVSISVVWENFARPSCFLLFAFCCEAPEIGSVSI